MLHSWRKQVDDTFDLFQRLYNSFQQIQNRIWDAPDCRQRALLKCSTLYWASLWQVLHYCSRAAKFSENLGVSSRGPKYEFAAHTIVELHSFLKRSKKFPC